MDNACGGGGSPRRNPGECARAAGTAAEDGAIPRGAARDAVAPLRALKLPALPGGRAAAVAGRRPAEACDLAMSAARRPAEAGRGGSRCLAPTPGAATLAPAPGFKRTRSRRRRERSASKCSASPGCSWRTATVPGNVDADLCRKGALLARDGAEGLPPAPRDAAKPLSGTSAPALAPSSAPRGRSFLRPVAEAGRRPCSKPRPEEEPKPQPVGAPTRAPARLADGRCNDGALAFLDNMGVPGLPGLVAKAEATDGVEAMRSPSLLLPPPRGGLLASLASLAATGDRPAEWAGEVPATAASVPAPVCPTVPALRPRARPSPTQAAPVRPAQATRCRSDGRRGSAMEC